MKKFTVNCDFGGQKSPVPLYIGRPKKDQNPVYNQSEWLSKNRGGLVPGKVMESLDALRRISEEEGVDLEDLCVYALELGEKAQKGGK